MRLLLPLGAIVLFFGFTQASHAQILTNTEQERSARFPGTMPYDMEPATQRYSYGTFGMFYLNANPRQLYYLDYLDRADRAKKFGYAMPMDPYFYRPMQEEEIIGQPLEGAPVVVDSAPQPTRVFGGFGLFRRR